MCEFENIMDDLSIMIDCEDSIPILKQVKQMCENTIDHIEDRETTLSIEEGFE